MANFDVIRVASECATALDECVAATIRAGALQQCLHRGRPFDERIKLLDLGGGERTPARGRRGAFRKAAHQLLRFPHGEAGRQRGVPTLTAFLSPSVAAQVRAEHGPADLVVANNVYAHTPDLIGFTQGLRTLVADEGWVSIEVQHLLSLVRGNQFDTIYHEHFQYYTVETAMRALATGGLSLVDVELLATHGGSIRLWAWPIVWNAKSNAATRPGRKRLTNRSCVTIWKAACSTRGSSLTI